MTDLAQPPLTDQQARSDEIRRQNDAFRKAFGPVQLDNGEHIAGRIFLTRGVADLGFLNLATIERLLTTHTPEDQDPEEANENDLIAIEAPINGSNVRIWFKIDYYENAECIYGSPDPANLASTYRVGTVLFPSEY